MTLSCRSILCSLLYIILAVAVVSCPGKSSSSRNAANAQPATLPPDWPFPQVTLPADATQHILPVFVSVDKGNGTYGIERTIPATGGDYVKSDSTGVTVGFNSSLSWDELVTHVENCISGSDFRLERSKGEGRIYISEDRMRLLMIVRRTIGNDAFCEINGFNSPVPLPEIPENMK